MAPKCRVTGCPYDAYRRRLCSMHYRRLLRYGGPGPVGAIGKRGTLDDRFINNVQVNGPIPEHAPQLGACAVWTGYAHRSGYGGIGSGHRLIYVHRLAYERAYGPIPPGMIVEQLCLNKLCVRDDHLRLARRSAHP